jgi:hypothetical protein
MNRKEFQEWLNQFPEDTEIECIITEERSGHWETVTDVYEELFDGIVKFDHLEHFGSMSGDMFAYQDWSTHKNVKPEDSFYNKKYLTIGKKN